MDRPNDAPDRGLRDHLGVLRRRWVIIVGITFLAVAAAVGYSLRQPTVYQASAQVLFVQEPTTVDDPSQDQMVQSKRLDPLRVIQNQTRLAESQLVRDQVEKTTGSSSSATAANIKDSDLITITASGSTPERAAAAANAWAAAYAQVSRDLSQQASNASLDAIKTQLQQIDDRLAAIDRQLADATTVEATRSQLTGERDALQTQKTGWTKQQGMVSADLALTTQNQVQIVDPATPPASPSQPATLRNALLALLVGLGLALAVAYAVDQIDDVIRSSDDLERASDLPVVAVVAGTAAPDKVRAVALDDPILRRDDTDPPFVLDDLAADDTARILLVPARSHGRKLRQNIALFEGLGHTIVGCALVRPAPEAAPFPPAKQEVGEPVTG